MESAEIVREIINCRLKLSQNVASMPIPSQNNSAITLYMVKDQFI